LLHAIVFYARWIKATVGKPKMDADQFFAASKAFSV
jgi:hypothetical protein